MDIKKLDGMLGKIEAMCSECRSMLEDDAPAEEEVDEESLPEEEAPEGEEEEPVMNSTKPKNLAIILALKKKMKK